MSHGKDRTTELFRELDKDGIGLIERKKQGQERPTRIYAKISSCPWNPASPREDRLEKAPYSLAIV